MKTKKNTISIVVVLIATTIFLSAVYASDNDPKKKPEIKTGRFMSSEDSGELKMFELGFHYMPTFYKMDFNTTDGGVVEGSVTTAHGFGGMFSVILSPHFGFQGEIDYYEALQKYQDQSIDNEVKIKYLDLPMLLSLNTNKMARLNLNAVVGPQFGINVGSDISSSGSNGTPSATATVLAKKGDIGAAFGAGIELSLTENRNIRVDLGYRGFYGFVKMDAEETDSEEFNVVVSANRKTNAMYVRLTFLF